MIEWLARIAGIKAKIGNYLLRATDVADYLNSCGTLEDAGAMASRPCRVRRRSTIGSALGLTQRIRGG